MCVCVSGTTVESRCPHACTNLFKILRLFLSSLEELISEFRRCLSSVYHMIYLTIHAKEAWTSLGYRERSSPFDFYATILLMIMSKLWEPFLIGGGLYEKQYMGKQAPHVYQTKQTLAIVECWFDFFFIEWDIYTNKRLNWKVIDKYWSKYLILCCRELFTFFFFIRKLII
jgi:hypothetical protein